jgi:hypothetical protein
MTKPQHHRGYVILRHKTRPLVHTADLSWYMSMPTRRRNKFLKDWEVVRICGG